MARPSFEEKLARVLRTAVREAYGVELDGIHVERPNEAAHGDFASNVALANAKVFRRNPREVARGIADALDAPSWRAWRLRGRGLSTFGCLRGL